MISVGFLEIMRSNVVFTSWFFFASAQAADIAASRALGEERPVDEFAEYLVDALSHRALSSRPLHHAALDSTTLGKSTHLAAPGARHAGRHAANARFSLPASTSAVRPRQSQLHQAHGMFGLPAPASRVQTLHRASTEATEATAELLAMMTEGELRTEVAELRAEVERLRGEQHGEKSEKSESKRANLRANKESETGSRIEGAGLIGGPFQRGNGSDYTQHRIAVFERIFQENEAKIAAFPDTPIGVTLPDGSVKEGVAFKTTPMDIALNISKGLANSVVIARVKYSKRLDDEDKIAEVVEELMDMEEEEGGEQQAGELWDLGRPLVGDCTLSLLKYDHDDPELRTVFWHSSAHILGAAVENTFGSHLTIGPPLQSGFYYDSFMGNNTVTEGELKDVEWQANKVLKAKSKFVRLEVSKDEALEMFAANPFKTSLIKSKVPDGGRTSVYRVGPMIDLCMGPHLPNAGKVKAFAATSASSANWLGQTDNDRLQRVYGISFPEKGMMKEWKELRELAKKRDHQLLGGKQELFFFNSLSPGSAFWLPHGTRVYNKLVDFIKEQYWSRGYEEVITPNMFNLKLWEQSGHAQLYKENMFTFEVEKEEFGLKPMNCPGHCCLFAHRVRSYRELPLRVADFGVLHRNELSGALSGLTRVRRFQQDDAHIFCTQDQIKEEVLGALDFMKFVYTIFGMSYKLELSTRPKKALGEIEIWDRAEDQLRQALNEFAGEGNWKVNPGDGAFYGPKIDIKVFDALKRVHQCATVQLDFQLPQRFDLKYQCAKDEAAANETANTGPVFSRPVMVHRAMLGSVERMVAVLTEHWGGKWPFWLSPRQICLVPVIPIFADYAESVQQRLKDAGFYVDVDKSGRTLNKKVREAQQAQYNFILVVGEKEQNEGTVNIRTRDNKQMGTMLVDEAIANFTALVAEYK
eukprot:gnl/TRDRNA2_/TRDRNA2_136402_c0_seq1.p1 gnl/TRDRNA2_/TRDRNA2_136402_c0~~gnl/TRDRNA2_/TRDRNA2_136402_c0_seq1.p1  ORF type:complete len:924 (+),score=186.86 gnl/TRDRNA2_/TRDRNA2_136402_c0_seq1:32-2803(+)